MCGNHFQRFSNSASVSAQTSAGVKVLRFFPKKKWPFFVSWRPPLSSLLRPQTEVDVVPGALALKSTLTSVDLQSCRATWTETNLGVVLYEDMGVTADRLEGCRPCSFWPDLRSVRARTFMQTTLIQQLHGCVICSSSSWQTHFLSGRLLACMSSGCHSLLKAFYVFCRYETEPWTGSQHECLWKVCLSRSLISQKCETLWIQRFLLLHLQLLLFLLILPFDLEFFFFCRASNYPTVSWREWLVEASVPVSFLMCCLG